MRLGSAFCGLTSHTNRPYVQSLKRSTGTWFFGMNLMVLVPLTLPPTPCANLPNSLADERNQSSRSLGCRRSCLYSSMSPVSSSMTAFAMWHKVCNGNFRLASERGCICAEEAWAVANRAIAIILGCAARDRVLYAGPAALPPVGVPCNAATSLLTFVGGAAGAGVPLDCCLLANACSGDVLCCL